MWFCLFYLTISAIMFIILDVMAKKTVILTPKVKRTLITVGEQIKLARLRRRLSVELVSERAGISRATLWAIENGSSTVSFGAYVSVLCALGFETGEVSR